MIQTLYLLEMADLARKRHLRDDGASRRSYGILARHSRAVRALPRLAQPWPRMCSPGVPGKVCSAQPGPHLLLLSCWWGELILPLQGEQEKARWAKFWWAKIRWAKVCAACSGTGVADGHPARTAELSCPALFWRWTPHLLLWLVWESTEAVTQKSPSSLLLRKFANWLLLK